MPDLIINIARTAGTGICVAASDGHKVYNAISDGIRRGDRVVLSFENVTRITTAFLNTAVGQLYSEFSEGEVKNSMAPPINANSAQLLRLKMVVDRAKAYFKNPEGQRKIFSEITGLDDDEEDQR